MANWFEQNAPKETGGGWFAQNAPKQVEPPAQPEGSWLSNLARDYWQKVNPVEAVKGVAQAVAHPIDTLSAIGQAQDERRIQAEEAFKRGDYATGARHVIEYLIPVLGPEIGREGDKAQAGNVGGAVGGTLGIATNVVLPSKIKDVKSVRVGPKFANPNPTEAAALDYLETRNVPVDAAARTGNAYVRNVQKAVDSTPIGGIVSQRAQTAKTTALRNEAASLTQRATPEVSADTLYQQFRDAEAQNVRKVQTGTRTVDTGVVDANGKPVTRSVPVTEDIPLPVNVKDLKEQIRPIYEEIKKWWEPAKRNASAGFQAMESILYQKGPHGQFTSAPDVIPASTAEAGLSGLKALAREGGGRNAGIAKFIIPKLQEMVDSAAAQGGKEVVDTLRQARKAAAQEVALDKITKIFEKAQAEGGFNREAGIWQDWQRSRSDVYKQVPPALASDLDKFFLGAKKLAENPNPSGTTVVGISAASGGLIFTNPATGIAVTLGTGALSKLLHSRAGVRALTRGVKIPLGDKAAASVASAELLRLAGEDLVPQN